MKKKDYNSSTPENCLKKTCIFLHWSWLLNQETINKIQAKLHKQISRLNFQVSLNF